MIRRLFSGFQTFLAVYPYVPLVLIHVMAVRAAVLMGHWPRPYLDDSLPVFCHDPIYVAALHGANNVLFIWLPAALVGPVLCLLPVLTVLLLPLALPGTSIRTRLIRLTVGLLGWALLITDPLHALQWWID